MTWFKSVWRRFFTWVASWLGEPPREPPKPRWDESAQDLIDLARKVKEERWKDIPDPKSVNHVSPEEYREMMRAQMEEAAAESLPPRVHRSASFRHCMDAVERDRKAEIKAQKQPLTLKVQK
jgi:hypothetical protein